MAFCGIFTSIKSGHLISILSNRSNKDTRERVVLVASATAAADVKIAKNDEKQLQIQNARRARSEFMKKNTIACLQE